MLLQTGFDGHDVKPGTHINAVGAYTPEMRELDDVTLRRSRIVLDTYEGCMAEAGDRLIPMKGGRISKESIHADLGEIVLSKKLVVRKRMKSRYSSS